MESSPKRDRRQNLAEESRRQSLAREETQGIAKAGLSGK